MIASKRLKTSSSSGVSLSQANALISTATSNLQPKSSKVIIQSGYTGSPTYRLISQGTGESLGGFNYAFYIGELSTDWSSPPPPGDYSFTGGSPSTGPPFNSIFNWNGTLTVSPTGYINLNVTSKGTNITSVTVYNNTRLSVVSTTLVAYFTMILTPIGALATNGDVDIFGTLTVTGLSTLADTTLSGTSILNNNMFMKHSQYIDLGYGVPSRESNAGKIGYQAFTAGALDIVGAGPSAGNRVVKIFDNLTVNGTINPTGGINANAGIVVATNQKISLPGSYTTLPQSNHQGGIVEVSFPSSSTANTNFATLSLPAGVWIVCFSVEATSQIYLTVTYTTCNHAFDQIGSGTTYMACGTYIVNSASTTQSCSLQTPVAATFNNTRCYHKAVRIA